jgi:hypothetical protein
MSKFNPLPSRRPVDPTPRRRNDRDKDNHKR